MKGAIEALTGFYDVFMGVVTGNGDRIKKGFTEQFSGLKAIFWDSGKNAAKAFGDGYNKEAKNQDSIANKLYEERHQQFAKRIKDALDKRLKAEAAVEKADLKERLARVQKDSEAEMRLKQQLVTNEAAQQLEDDKKTAAERRIILADALDKRVKLVQEYHQKQAERRKQAIAMRLKARLAEIEAEKLHQEMLA